MSLFSTKEIDTNVAECYTTFYSEYNTDIVGILETHIIKDLCNVITSFVIPEVTKKFIESNKVVTFEIMTLDGTPAITTNYGYTDIFLVLQSRISLNNVGKNNFKILDATLCDIYDDTNYNKLKQVQIINGFHSSVISIPKLPLLKNIYLFGSVCDNSYISDYTTKNPNIVIHL